MSGRGVLALDLGKTGCRAAIYAFILAWNEFLFALTFISDESMRTLPVVIFFLFVQHRLTQGMVAGAVKE